MLPFKKIRSISDFLKDLHLNDHELYFSTNQADATTYLSKASKKAQIIVARPEMTCYPGHEEISSVIFILQKDLGAGNTNEKENCQYDETLVAAELIILDIEEAVGNGCSGPLPGVELESYTVTPESSVFGGWKGYSIELNFA